MWWDIEGTRDRMPIRFRVQAINEEVASKLAEWKGIEVSSVEEERPAAKPEVSGSLLEAFGPFIGDFPPTLAE